MQEKECRKHGWHKVRWYGGSKHQPGERNLTAYRKTRKEIKGQFGEEGGRPGGCGKPLVSQKRSTTGARAKDQKALGGP